MFDPISLGVREIARSRGFYDAALAPLGYGPTDYAAYVVEPDGLRLEALTDKEA